MRRETREKRKVGEKGGKGKRVFFFPQKIEIV
jgi:hypothetical protein